MYCSRLPGVSYVLLVYTLPARASHALDREAAMALLLYTLPARASHALDGEAAVALLLYTLPARASHALDREAAMALLLYTLPARRLSRPRRGSSSGRGSYNQWVRDGDHHTVHERLHIYSGVWDILLPWHI